MTTIETCDVRIGVIEGWPRTARVRLWPELDITGATGCYIGCIPMRDEFDTWTEWRIYQLLGES